MSTILNGSYTSDGEARTIYVPSSCDSFEWFVQGSSAGDNWDSTANPGVIKRGWWFKGMGSQTALAVYNTDGAATDQSTFISADGFEIIDPDAPSTYTATAVTNVSQAAAAVVTSASHGLVTGDLVRLTDITGMQQISSLVFSVTRIDANTLSIPIASTAFAAVGTGGYARRVNKKQFDPKRLWITGITKASSMVVSVSTTHLYHVGSKVRLIVPDEFGMTQANGLLGEVTAIGDTSLTLDIDSSAFTAFAYPTSATAAAGVTFPQVVPVGEDYSILTDRIYNSDVRGVHLGVTAAGANGALVLWRATQSQGYNVTAD